MGEIKGDQALKQPVRQIIENCGKSDRAPKSLIKKTVGKKDKKVMHTTSEGIVPITVPFIFSFHLFYLFPLVISNIVKV